MPEQSSLYQRLGGYDTISKFAEDALTRAMKDDVIGPVWQHMSQDRVFEEHKNFVDWLCAHWGGDVVYRGRDLATVHRGMGITEQHWDGLFAVLEQSYDHFGLPDELRQEVNAFLRKFKPVVVGSPSFRDVVKESDDQNFMVGMAAMGVKWPTGRTQSSRPPEAK